MEAAQKRLIEIDFDILQECLILLVLMNFSGLSFAFQFHRSSFYLGDFRGQNNQFYVPTYKSWAFTSFSSGSCFSLTAWLLFINPYFLLRLLFNPPFLFLFPFWLTFLFAIASSALFTSMHYNIFSEKTFQWWCVWWKFETSRPEP